MKKTLYTLAAVAFGSVLANGACIGQWDFEDNLNAAVGTNGTAKGSPAYVDSLSAGYVLGNYQVANDLGKALSLDGSSWVGLGSVDYKNEMDPEVDSFTVSSYIYLNSGADFSKDYVSIFATGSGASSGIALGVQKKNDGYCFDFLRKYKAHEQTGQITELTANAWHHFAVSYDHTTTTAYWYLDGDLVATQTLADASINAPGGEGSVIGSGGQDMQDAAWKGYLDNVQVYTTALSQAEILTNAGLIAVVPEPATASLSLLGLAALMLRRRRA